MTDSERHHEVEWLKKRVHLGGWKRDQYDSRDQPFSLKLHRGITPNPPRMTLRPYCAPIEDQGELGACTAFAVIAAIEANSYLRRVVKWFAGSGDAPPPKQQHTDLSHLALYWHERWLLGTVDEDSGGTIRATIKAAAKHGVGPESEWPYVPEKFREPPPTSFDAQARKHRVTSYHRIFDADLESVKAALALGSLVVCGIEVARPMLSEAVARTGSVPTPHSGFIGGHAIALTGYDDALERFEFRNSWGSDWGVGGYGSIGYDYVGSAQLANDFWVISSEYAP